MIFFIMQSLFWYTILIASYVWAVRKLRIATKLPGLKLKRLMYFHCRAFLFSLLKLCGCISPHRVATDLPLDYFCPPYEVHILLRVVSCNMTAHRYTIFCNYIMTTFFMIYSNKVPAHSMITCHIVHIYHHLKTIISYCW